eukprot:Blabericola_migrator_1__5991@NODE_301_length_10180_cov_125_201226_g247_i0_p2_GENE_NODE_301_length_10180_cov_125_201226_g247_i0NODE_301_length_10180_cov_125_201226_g247_i0_p2_ORF_typecomplete_len666_score97_38DAGK_acc/PF00609_19/1_7e26DAGK_cat/PF00781_24/1_5e14NAD_kinase/PF01513_21/0_18_NODE_301_length_10180_cov_125_201226_g247_i0807410071
MSEGAKQISPETATFFENIDTATYFFIVVNPRSGGNAASVLLETGFNYYQFHLISEQDYSLYPGSPHTAPALRASPRTAFIESGCPTLTQWERLLREQPLFDGRPRSSTSFNESMYRRSKASERRSIPKDPVPSPAASIIKVFIADIRDGPSGDKDVFKIIRRVAAMKQRQPQLDKEWRVRVMVAGGDGTAMWTFSELQRHKVDPEAVLVGVIPFGTGNDFANATGSQIRVSIPDETPSDMIKRLISHWMTFISASFDLWSVHVKAQPQGYFEKVDSSTRKKRLIKVDNSDAPVTKLDFAMANYFSLGVESRIGVGFDRNRKSNAAFNKMAYAVEGVKKALFHRRRSINDLVEGLYVITDASKSKRVIFQSTHTPTSSIRRAMSTISDLHQSFLGSRSESRVEPNLDAVAAAEHPILQSCVSLCFLNIPSFAGGADIWRSSAGRLGVTLPEHGADPMMLRRIEQCIDPLESQDFGDGRLEVVSFRSIVELGASNIRNNLEKLVPASFIPTGWRIYRGGGSFELQFHNDLDPKQRIYFQVDGEYYIGYKLESFALCPDTRVKILVRPDKLPSPEQRHTLLNLDVKDEAEQGSNMEDKPMDLLTESEDCFNSSSRPSVLSQSLHPLVEADLLRTGDESPDEWPAYEEHAMADLKSVCALNVAWSGKN